MSKEVVFVLEPDVGRVTVEISQAAKQTANDLADDLGKRVNLNCAKPSENERYLPVLQPQPKPRSKLESMPFRYGFTGFIMVPSSMAQADVAWSK